MIAWQGEIQAIWKEPQTGKTSVNWTVPLSILNRADQWELIKATDRKGSKLKRVQITWNQDYAWPLQSVLHCRSCKQPYYVATHTLIWVKKLNLDISFYIDSHLVQVYTKRVAWPQWKISLSADLRHMWIKTQKKFALTSTFSNVHLPIEQNICRISSSFATHRLHMHKHIWSSKYSLEKKNKIDF